MKNRIIVAIVIGLAYWATLYAQSPVNDIGAGCALQFDGIAYVEIPNTPSLNTSYNGLTIEAWIKPQVSSVPYDAQSIVVKWAWDRLTDHYGLWLSSNNKVIIAVADGITPEPGLTGNTSLQPGKWYHIAGTWDGTTREYRIYINGILDAVGLQTGNGMNISSPVTLKMGRQIVGVDRPFIGEIDEIRIWSRVLTQNEIQQNMCRRLTGTELDLVGYWRIDECSGNIAFDATTNANHGTLY